MLAGKGYQKGFVRRVGMTPSGTDRQNKRSPAVRFEPDKESEQKAKLMAFEETHPDLYAEAEKIVRRFSRAEEETPQMMLKYIEDSIKERERIKHEEDLFATHKRRRTEQTEQ